VAKPKRTCIFCGSSPTTSEHHPPQWIRECFPNQAALRFLGKPDGTYVARGQSAHMAAIKINHVCRGCNNGWMADIERVTKPVLLPLIQGKASRLRKLDQIAIATWMLKSALTIGPGIDWDVLRQYRDCFDDFYRCKKPNEYHDICIAGCDTNNLSHMKFRAGPVYQNFPDGKRVEHKGFWYTLLIGHFVGTVAFRPLFLRGKAPIWPGSPFTAIWPAGTGPIRKAWPGVGHLKAEAVYEVSRGPESKIGPENPKPPVPPQRI
jgi:hypothetical protein